jgi:hypothetical protein
MEQERLVRFAEKKQDLIIANWFQPRAFVHLGDDLERKTQIFYSGELPSIKEAQNKVFRMLVLQALFGEEHDNDSYYSFQGLASWDKLPNNFELAWDDCFLFYTLRVHCTVVVERNMKPIFKGPESPIWTLSHQCRLDFMYRHKSSPYIKSSSSEFGQTKNQ